MIRFIATCLVFAAASASCQQTSDKGEICGAVQDEKGAPAAHVGLVAVYLGGHSGMYPTGKTDEAGRYCIESLSLGTYAVSADDPEKGYPSMSSSFYSPQPMGPRVSLTAENLRGRLDWRIPYKAGFVRVQLTDAKTGKPIVAIYFSLMARENPKQRFMRGGTASTMPLLVPPNEDIYFNVTVPGYKEWPGDGTKGMVLNVLPGATETIAIALQPIIP